MNDCLGKTPAPHDRESIGKYPGHVVAGEETNHADWQQVQLM
ncbi:hypothetical protein [Mycolicibacter sinensis]|nr:hypothetical protein [Mycolicibacter sinensis]